MNFQDQPAQLLNSNLKLNELILSFGANTGPVGGVKGSAYEKENVGRACKRIAGPGNHLTKCAKPPRRATQRPNVTWVFAIRAVRGCSRITRKRSSGFGAQPSRTMQPLNVTWDFAIKSVRGCRRNTGRRPNGFA